MGIKFENVVTPSPEQWRSVVMGARNPLNSWDRYDSGITYESPHDMSGGIFKLGSNDYQLLMKLRNAGTADHRKFMRMLPVHVTITAPLYWWKEMDQYRIGVTTNSCSTMHKIHAKEFTLEDFSHEHLISEYNFKNYFDISHNPEALIKPILNYSDYDIGADGMVYSRKGGKRIVLKPHVDVDGYKTVGLYLDGKVKRIKVHRLVAETFLPKENGKDCVNHRDGNKWNNSVDNLEWCTRSENSKHACDNRLNVYGSKQRYGKAKKRRFSAIQIEEIKELYNSGISQRKLGDMYGCDHSVVSEIVNGKIYKNIERFPLEQLEYTVEILNNLRTCYNETGDKRYWRSMIQLLPSSYNQKRTVMLNYEVLANIYKSRKGHKLDEWNKLCSWIETLPYSELIMGDRYAGKCEN